MLSPSAVSLLLVLARVSKAAFLLESPPTLTACGDATYSWEGGAFPMRLNLGDEDRAFTANRATTWTVNYPAGTLLNVRIDSGSGGSPNYAYAGSLVVQPGTTESCVPPQHLTAPRPADPIQFTTIPTQLVSCQTSSFAWSGGRAPYTILAIGVNSAGAVATYTTQTPSFDWRVDFPGGSTVYLNIVGANYLRDSAPSFTRTMYVYNGTTDACVSRALVNASYSEPPRRVTPVVITSAPGAESTSVGLPTGNRSSPSSSLPAGAIAGIVIGVVFLISLYFLYALLRKRQKRQQQQQRADVVGMQKLESAVSLEKVVVGAGGAGGGSASVSGVNAHQPYAPRVSSRMAPVDQKMKGRAV